MKKILFIFITLFVFIPFSNALSKFSLGDRVPNMHIGSISSQNVSYNAVPFVLKRDDGAFVYCLEHQLKINTTDYYNEYNYNDERFKLSDEQINKINTLAYYGYGYKNHIGVEWYGVTQFLIWKELDYRDVFFTDKPYGNRIVAYKNEMTEIRELVKLHNTLPSFSNDNFVYTVGTTYKIEDSNNVLSNYDIKESNIDVEIKDNSLYISPKKSGNYEIIFIRKSPTNRNYILYEHSGNQPLIYPGRINDIEFKINVQVNSGSITINNLDSENKERMFANLEGAVYGVYNEDELITTITTDISGIGYLEELPLGSYKVKQINPSLGYKLDDKTYEIQITNQNKDIVIDSYSEIIKGNIIINKYFGSEDDYKLEDGAIFNVYDINNNLIGNYESIDGIVNIELEYGKYYIDQIKGIEGHKLNSKKYITIIEEKEYIMDFYDEIIIGDLTINKYYDDNLEDGAVFEIYDMANNLIGTYETENGIINIKLEYGEYYGIQKSGVSGYNLVDKFNISIKEEKEYIIDLYSEKEEVLIVEVPDTKKYDYNKFISIILIIVGSLFIIRSKKTTH